MSLKTRKQIFEEKWLPIIKNSNKIKHCKYDGEILYFITLDLKEYNYIVITNLIVCGTDIPIENGLKWLIKNIEL